MHGKILCLGGRCASMSGLLVLLAILLFLPQGGVAKIPEPESIIYGMVGDMVETVTLKIDGEVITSYTTGSSTNPEAEGYYVLRVPMDALDPQEPGTARPGDVASLYVNEEVDPVGTVVVEEKGDIQTYHVNAQDTDGDGLPDALEEQTCTNPLDADTDDDGLPDGVEDSNRNGIVNWWETDPCNPDTDGDGIQDGTEMGITQGHPTYTNLGFFQPDMDPSTTTNPLSSDSDGDGIPDGVEDANHNGMVDDGESDPGDSDIFEIVSITQDWEGETYDVTISWETEAGESYDISLKDDLESSFEIVDSLLADDVVTSWTDDGSWAGGTHPNTVEQRYYKVTQGPVDTANTVGMYRVTCQEGMNLRGLPLVPMEGTLEGILGCQLTGADNERDADRVWTWNGTNYQMAWLVEGVGPPYDGTWYTGSAPTTITLGPDQGLWVHVREGHGATDVSILGELSLQPRVIPMAVGMNLVAPSYPVAMPLGDQAPDDGNLWESGATGADNERDADRVWSWTGTNYQIHWLVDGVDPAYDGLWFSGNNPSTLWIEPGEGYWIQIREGHEEFDWQCPPMP